MKNFLTVCKTWQGEISGENYTVFCSHIYLFMTGFIDLWHDNGIVLLHLVRFFRIMYIMMHMNWVGQSIRPNYVIHQIHYGGISTSMKLFLANNFSLWYICYITFHECTVCRTNRSPWICLKCGIVNCGRYVVV